jgi:hypothetical protein
VDDAEVHADRAGATDEHNATVQDATVHNAPGRKAAGHDGTKHEATKHDDTRQEATTHDANVDDATVDELVERWRCYARRNLAEAAVRQDSGDLFGAALSNARAEVRAAGAELLRRAAGPTEAAKAMHRKVCELWLTDLPLLGFDAAAVQYTRARTWQDCAHTLDPSLPEIQPRLEWT